MSRAPLDFFAGVYLEIIPIVPSRGYFSESDRDRLSLLAGRAAIATTRLLRYLRSARTKSG